MALNVKSDRADRLARERARRLRPDPTERLARIARAAHALAFYDARSADEILGYDDEGLPT
jgi:hypothetical protein